jgi:hypothetical protein
LSFATNHSICGESANSSIKSQPAKSTGSLANTGPFAFLPLELTACPHWVDWKREPGQDGKLTKVLYVPAANGRPRRAKSSDPTTWGSFENAQAALAKHRFDGVAFVPSDLNEFTVIDLDNCRDPDTGAIEDWAMAIILGFNSYWEISPSGRGVHIWVRGKVLGGPRRTNIKDLPGRKIEVFPRLQFVTVTGNRGETSPETIEARQTELQSFHIKWFPPQICKSSNSASTRPVGAINADDEAVIAKIRQSKQGLKFDRLFAGDTSDYGGDHSSADFALCNILSFWCDGKASWIDSIFRQSGLIRAKWDSRRGNSTYGAQTIERVLSDATEFYEWPKNGRANGHVNESQNGYVNGSDPGSIDEPTEVAGEERGPAQAPETEAAQLAEKKPAGKKKDPGSEKRAGPSQATMLLRLASDLELFHTPEGKSFATVSVDGHNETYGLASKKFKVFLRRRFYQDFRAAIGSQALNDAIGVLEGKALFDGPNIEVYVRVAEHGENIYIDLADETWRSIEISKEGWNVVANAPVRFRRTMGMMPLPVPVRNDADAETNFRACINYGSEENLLLIKEFELASMRPRGPYPVLVLGGQHGAAKSTMSSVLRRLIDPNKSPLRSQPKEERDLAIGASNGWVQCLDNISHLPNWLSDAICGVATGRGFATRELHTDEDEVLFNVCRPCILNGIEEVATRGDLMDRSLIIELPEIPKKKRMPEKAFWKDFKQFQPGIIGYFLDALVGAMGNVDDVNADDLPRMADFAQWSIAAEVPLGYEEGAFRAAYTENREAANTVTLEASPIARYIQIFIEKHDRSYYKPNDPDWEGPATTLLKELNYLAGDQEQKQNTWPKNGRALSCAIKRLIPNFAAIGINFEFSRESSERRISIRKSPSSRAERHELSVPASR